MLCLYEENLHRTAFVSLLIRKSKDLYVDFKYVKKMETEERLLARIRELIVEVIF